MTSPPPPIQGGSRIMCPMIDVAAMEAPSAPLGEILMCGWHRRGKTARPLKAYRRHWRREHWAPFEAGTHGLLRFLAPARLFRGAEIQVSVSKGHDGDG